MSFLSNYEGQGCGATSKDRPTYPSPPALSSCSHIPLVSSGSALWSKLSIPNKSSPPQLFQFAELFTFSCWVSPSTLGRVRICVWSLFSVSTRCLWTPVKVCVKDWAVNWKLWVRAGSLALRAVPVLLLQTCWDDKQRVRRHLCSVIKNNGIVCRMVAVSLKLSIGSICLFFTLLPFPLRLNVEYFKAKPSLLWNRKPAAALEMKNIPLIRSIVLKTTCVVSFSKWTRDTLEPAEY